MDALIQTLPFDPAALRGLSKPATKLALGVDCGGVERGGIDAWQAGGRPLEARP